MNPLIIDGKNYTYRHTMWNLPRYNPLDWLKKQTLFPKVYWASPSSHQVRLAIGHCLHFPLIPRLDPLAPPEVRLYGGCSFTGQTHFWLPAFEFTQDNAQATLHRHEVDGHPPQKSPLPPPWQTDLDSAEGHLPSLAKWEKTLQTAMQAIESGDLEKVVLARKTTRLFPSPPDPYALLEQQIQKNPHAISFIFQWSEELAWIGSSPEKLYHRQNNQLTIDALAGTRPRGATPPLDIALEQALLTSPKEQREFNHVKAFIDAALTPLSIERQWLSSDQVLKLSHVQHRYNVCSAKLKETTTDRALIEALHPTPALGGTPRASALTFIANHEPPFRHSYGAPLGYLSSKETEMAVGIRSALVRPASIELFAGVGIVAGSTPEAEWEELNAKIQQWDLT